MSVLSLDDIPATGTGTLVIQLQDVNDNAPTIEERDISVCLNPQELNAHHILNTSDTDES